MSSKLRPLLPAMLALATLLSGCAAVDPKGVAPSSSPAADSVVDPQASLILAAAAKVYAVVVTFSRFGEPWTPMVPTAADEAPDVAYERW